MSGICWTFPSTAVTSLSAVSEEVPVPAKSVKLLLMFDRFPFRLSIWAVRVFRPVKKAEPFDVTFPLRRSSTNIAVEHPRWFIAGPKLLTFEKPELVAFYHRLRLQGSYKEPGSKPLLASRARIWCTAHLLPSGSTWKGSSEGMCNSSIEKAR